MQNKIGLDFDPDYLSGLGGETSVMCTAAAPAGPADKLDLLESLMRSLASADPAGLAEAEVARRLRILERVVR